MRVAIVNDIETAVQHLTRLVTRQPGYSVAWTAADGAEAVDKAQQDRPDLILMDLIMPLMNGVEATRRIMEVSPCAILVVTAGINDRVSMVFEALGAGAMDAVDMPVTGGKGEETLIRKIHNLATLVSGVRGERGGLKSPQAGLKGLVALGASTGGPLVLRNILSLLPAEFPAGLVIIQHVDRRFAAGMSNWFNGFTALEVRPARTGDKPQAGLVLVSATNDHLVMDADGSLRYTVRPQELVYRPSIDVFFQSLSAHWRQKLVAVLLTGMGADGAKGLLRLKSMGHLTLVQDRTSSSVYGMPRAAVDLGAASLQLSPDKIAGRLIKEFPAAKTGNTI